MNGYGVLGLIYLLITLFCTIACFVIALKGYRENKAKKYYMDNIATEYEKEIIKKYQKIKSMKDIL